MNFHIYFYSYVIRILIHEGPPLATEFDYLPQSDRSASFTFKLGAKPVKAWVRFGAGEDAVFGFDDLNNQSSYATLANGKWVIGKDSMMSTMKQLHKRGNLTAGNTKKNAIILNDSSVVELSSIIENGKVELTVLKAKSVDSAIIDIFMTISLDGVSSLEEAQKILTVLRPVIERQIEF